MKNWFPFLFITGILFFTSCSDNGQSNTLSSGQQSTMKEKHKSRGSLSFKLNGAFFEADPAHTKAWSNTQIPLAMLTAKNDKGLSVSIQIQNFTAAGTFKLDSDKRGGATFTVNGKDYGTRSVMKDDYLTVVVTGIKSLETVLLLSGTFEGVLEDKDGNKVQITEGRFTTEKL